MLILQNRRDPVTPLAGGELLREKGEKRLPAGHRRREWA
nr:hypothetical protein [Kribbella flavida]